MAKPERFCLNFLGITLTKEKKEGWFNPKRIKIISGIFLILALGVLLDFVIPVNGKVLSKDQQIAYAVNIAGHISGIIDEYYNMNGNYPEDLYGGDSAGYKIAKNHPVDPLIEKKLIEEYPKVRQNSIAIRRRLISLIMNKDTKDEICRFGKNGNRMGNISIIYDDMIFEDFIAESDVNPLSGHFYYKSHISDVPNYTLLIAGDSFVNSLDIINKSNGLFLPDGIPDGFIYGFTVTVENGQRKKTEFFAGDNQ